MYGSLWDKLAAAESLKQASALERATTSLVGVDGTPLHVSSYMVMLKLCIAGTKFMPRVIKSFTFNFHLDDRVSS